MSATVSVIVPIYKVEPYLEKCVDSILAQTYTQLDIILVDDGSPDRCPEICDALAAKDSRIRVIHKKNGGLSSARNAGLDIAVGDYIMFTDSDDHIDADMVETMVQAIEENRADIVTVNVRSESTSGVCKERVMPMQDEVRTFERLDYPELMKLYGKQVSIFSVNNLYRMGIVQKNSLRFQPTQKVLSEDQLFNLCYYASVRKAVYISRPFYTYQVRDNTLSRSKSPSDILDRRVTLVQELKAYLSAHNFPKQREFFFHNLMWSYLIDGCRAIGTPDSIMEGLNHIRQGNNNKTFQKMLWDMLLGKAGRRYRKKYNMSVKSLLYFKFMLCLLLCGQYTRPANTYLCSSDV